MRNSERASGSRTNVASAHWPVSAVGLSTTKIVRIGRSAALIAKAPFAPAPYFDLLVSNPPYVPAGATNVMVDVERHEPATALYGGADGLGPITRLAVDAARVVRPGGWWISEFGDGQEEPVVAALDAARAWSVLRVRDDLQGIARVIVAQRQAH